MYFRSVFYLYFIFVSCTPAYANTFDFLRQEPKERRVKLARDFYKKEFRRTDSITTFKALEELTVLARSLGDHALETWVYDFQADYYSVNRGFNAMSPACHQKAIDLSFHYDLDVEAAIHTHKKGMFYNTFKHYV
jgi:hypothetical protein